MRGAGVWLAGLLLLAPQTAWAKPPEKARVSFELATESGFPITGAQDWYKLFTELGVANLQIRGATAGDKVEVEKRGTADSASYFVTGRLKADNSLQLPGAKFTLRDGARLKKWMADLADQGVDGVAAARSAFGLTAGQLKDVNADLSNPVSVSTTNLPAPRALEQIGATLGHRLQVDAAARPALAAVTVEEELRGLSSGTALAVILRPAGLVLTPERPAGGALQYRVGTPAAGQEAWPIGWRSEQRDQEIVPELFNFINVDIDDTPLPDALAALQGRLKMPFLWDHNALALHGIEPAKIQVKLPAKKLTYSLILNKLLSQAKLKRELRVDEAGKPFLWITTIKPS